MESLDSSYMKRALELAERGRGFVEPNPLVGAVVVRHGEIIGEGWHQRYGEAHAEVHALQAAGEAARGATLYVTLEPCCHHGKTPPCTDAIIRAGLSRVVAATVDPYPAVGSKGRAALVDAGIGVEFGPNEAEARRLNAPYFKLLQTGRPYVHAKWAMTLDGKIATRTGDSKWISNDDARRWVHVLRGRMDAIIVGIGTVLRDDPQLTARPPGPRTATRIVLDSHARLPKDSVLAKTVRETPVILAHAGGALKDQLEESRGSGCETLRLPALNGRADVGALLDQLGRRRMTNVLVEGGSAVLGSFLDVHAIDEVHVFITPILVGGANAITPMGGIGVERIADSLALTEWRTEIIGNNIAIHGRRNT